MHHVTGWPSRRLSTVHPCISFLHSTILVSAHFHHHCLDYHPESASSCTAFGFGGLTMSYDGVQQWLDQVESARASHSDTRNDDRPKHIEVLTPPSTSLLPFGTAIKRNIESQSSEMEAPKRPRDRKSTRLNSSHSGETRMPSSA